MATTPNKGNRKGTTWAHNPGTFPLDAPGGRTKNVATQTKNKKETTKRGGRSANSTSKSSAKRETNPGTKTVSAGTSLMRFRNPLQGVSTSSIVIGALGMAGFDWLAHKTLGAQSEPVAAVTKIGGGFLLMSGGKNLPLVGKHADLIGKGLILVGVYGLVRVYVLPRVVSYFQPAPQMATAPTTTNAALAGLRRPQRGIGARPGLGNIPNSVAWRGAGAGVRR